MTDILLGILGAALCLAAYHAGKRTAEGKPIIPNPLPQPKGKAVSLDRVYYPDGDEE